MFDAAQAQDSALSLQPLRLVLAPYMEDVSTIAELAGVCVIVAGAVLALALFLLRSWRDGVDAQYRALRANLGRSILLGLELMVAADIIRSVAIHPTWEGLGTLGAIVLVPTFLSVSLEVEIEGRWPWRRARGDSS